MINSIGLANFKVFESQRISLRPLTMLTGVNGAGKSTVLQSLLLLRQSHDAGCLGEGLLLNGELVELGSGKDVLYEGAKTQEVVFSFEEGESIFSWVFRSKERDDLLQTVQCSEPGFSPEVFAKGFHFLGADRVAPAAVFPTSYTKVVRHRSVGIRGEFSAHFLAFHQDEVVSERRRWSGSETSSSLLDQVSYWMNEISPGVNVGSDELRRADLAQLWFTFGGRAGLASTNQYRPTNVGFGLTYSLPVVILCLSARAGDIILLENPEAHLHPRGQAALGQLLCKTASDGVQIIFETHSDHILNAIRLGPKRGQISPEDVAIHYFDRSSTLNASVVSPKLRSDGKLTGWPVGFFDEWESALMELI